MSSCPEISVIIPLYNHEKFINEAVRSVLNQSYGDIELIVIDDGSKDKSGKIVQSIRDPRLKYIYQDNQGAHNAINNGIKLANGKYISILNSDDIYYENRFEMFIGAIKNDPNIKLLFSDIEIIDANGKFLRYKGGANDNWYLQSSLPSFRDDNDIMLNLLAGNYIVTTSNIFCEKSIFEKVGLFKNYRYAHDYDFVLNAVYHYRDECKYLENPLMKYRIHSTNTISESEARVSYEVGLIFSDFFRKCDFRKLFKRDFFDSEFALKFYNSLNSLKMDRMILISVLLSMQRMNENGDLIKELIDQPINEFSQRCFDDYNQNK